MRVGRGRAGVGAACLVLALAGCASGPTNYEGVSGGLLPWAGALRPPEGYARRVNPLPANASAILEGRQVFAVTCAACHGPDMRGRGLSGVNVMPHPADLRAPHLANLSDGELYGYIAEGVHGTGMPAWKLVLTTEQMQAAERYVHSQGLVVPQDARVNPVPDSPGAITLGRQVFTQICASCHGLNARGAGPAGRSLQPRPADLTAPEVQRYSDGQLLWILEHGVTGTPMAGWVGQKVITHQQAWTILRYLRRLGKVEANPTSLTLFNDGFYRSYPVMSTVGNTFAPATPESPVKPSAKGAGK